MKASVLLTGAGGFLGSAVFRRLITEQVVVVGTFRNNRTRLPAEGDARFVQCDLADRSAVERLFEKVRPSITIHTAAAVGSETSLDFLKRAVADNLTVQTNLASAAVSCGCERIVSCSSISVYGEGAYFSEGDPVAPRSIYGWSKLQGERILDFAAAEAPALAALSLRFAGIHGAGRTTGAMANMIAQASTGHDLSITEPESRFQFLFVEDAAEALWLAASHPLSPGHHRYNVAGRDTIRLSELAERIVALSGKQSGINCTDGAVARDRTMNTAAFHREFGFEPAPLDRRLAEMIAGRGKDDAA